MALRRLEGVRRSLGQPVRYKYGMEVFRCASAMSIPCRSTSGASRSGQPARSRAARIHRHRSPGHPLRDRYGVSGTNEAGTTTPRHAAGLSAARRMRATPTKCSRARSRAIRAPRRIKAACSCTSRKFRIPRAQEAKRNKIQVPSRATDTPSTSTTRGPAAEGHLHARKFHVRRVQGAAEEARTAARGRGGNRMLCLRHTVTLAAIRELGAGAKGVAVVKPEVGDESSSV